MVQKFKAMRKHSELPQLMEISSIKIFHHLLGYPFPLSLSKREQHLGMHYAIIIVVSNKRML